MTSWRWAPCYQDNGEDALIMWRTPATLNGSLEDVPAAGREERGARVVAARLDREDHGAGVDGVTGPAAGMSSSEPFSVAGVRHMMRASSPLSW